MNKTILKTAALFTASMVMISGATAATLTLADGAVGSIETSATANRINTFTGNLELYVVNTFDFNLSNGVELKTKQDRNAIVVGTATPRGRNHFTGSSQGGSVASCGPATTGNTTPALTDAMISLLPADLNGCTLASTAAPAAD